MAAINTFRCTVDRHGAPVGAAPPQTHFTVWSVPPPPPNTYKHRYVDAPRHFLSSTAHTYSTRRPASPCSKTNEFATVLNHFNHLNGKCLIHSYLSVLPRSSVMSTHSLSPPKHPRLQTDTHTGCLVVRSAPCNPLHHVYSQIPKPFIIIIIL